LVALRFVALRRFLAGAFLAALRLVALRLVAFLAGAFFAALRRFLAGAFLAALRLVALRLVAFLAGAFLAALRFFAGAFLAALFFVAFLAGGTGTTFLGERSHSREVATSDHSDARERTSPPTRAGVDDVLEVRADCELSRVACSNLDRFTRLRVHPCARLPGGRRKC